MQIAIDGPAGAGKSTIAKLVAKRYKITYLDTGAMYRAITWLIDHLQIDFKATEEIIEQTKNAEITFQDDRVFLNGQDVSKEIRMPKISEHTSDIAKIKEVREILVDRQRKIAVQDSVIMDGRDIASVVLPDADYKFYLDASVEERGRRRYEELLEKGDPSKSYEVVCQDIQQRDYYDRHRKESPLICTKDAMIIDTTGLNISEVCEAIYSKIDEDKNDRSLLKRQN